jgi:hypothetical protein
MKIKALMVLLAALSLCGCAQSYVIKMNNGVTLHTASKPKLQRGYYMYKDAKGGTNYVSQGRVVEIAPASMAAKDPKFIPRSASSN